MLEFNNTGNDRDAGAAVEEPDLRRKFVTMPAIPVSLQIVSQPVVVTPKVAHITQEMNGAARGEKSPVEVVPAIPEQEPSRPLATYSDEMLALIAQPRDEFFFAAKDHLTKKKSGGLAGHMISGTMVEKWLKLMEKPTYYVNGEDDHLIVENGPYYADLVRDGGKYKGRISLFELGSGLASQKTRHIIEAIEPDDYGVAERSMEAIVSTMTMVGGLYPDVAPYGIFTSDFDRDNLDNGLILAPRKMLRPAHANMERLREDLNNRKLPQDSRRVFVGFGATLGNMEGFANDPLPAKAVINALKNYRRHAKPGDFLILGIDQNQNERTLDECYGDPVHEEIADEMMKRITQSLPTRNFFPNDFVFTREWSRANHLYSLGWQAQRETNFVVDGEHTRWNTYETFHSTNGWRYPQEFMDWIYPQTDWYKITDHNYEGRMSHQVLVAVPGLNHLSL